MRELKHYEIPQYTEFTEGTDTVIKKIAAVVEDTKEQAVVEAVLDAAKAEGITDLYLMDRKFILDALLEKKERENPKPLSFEEALAMKDQPVWVEYLNNPRASMWAVVEGGIDLDGEKTMWMRSELFHFKYGTEAVAYKYKPKEKKK